MNYKINTRFSLIIYYLIILIPAIYLIGQGVFNLIFHTLCLIGFYYFIKFKKIIEFQNFFLTYITIILVLIFSNFIRGNFEYLPESILELKYFFWIYLIIIISKEITVSEKHNKILLSLFILILLFLIFHMIYQLLLYSEFQFDDFVGYRLYLPFTDELILGYYSFIVLISSLMLLNFIDFQYANLLKLLTIIIVSILILFSGERSTIINLVIFVFFYLIFFKPQVKYLFFMGVLILVSSTILFTNLSDYKKSEYFYRFDTTIKEISDFKKTSYYIHYKNAFEIFKNYKFSGSGVNSFRDECKKDRYNSIANVEQRCRTHPHNLHLQILSEAGILAYILYTILLFQIILSIIRQKNCKLEIKFLSLLFILTIFFPLKPTGNFFSSLYGGMLWYQLGLIILFTRFNK